MTDQRPLLLHVFSTFKAGGPQVRAVQLIEALGSRYRHRIIAMDDCYDAMQLFKKPKDIEIGSPPNLGGGLLSRIWGLRIWLQRQMPAKLFTYNWGAIEVAAAAFFCPEIKHFHYEDGFGPDEAVDQLRRRIWFRRLALLRTKQVIVPSRRLQYIAEHIWKLPGAKIRLIENGIDAAAFDKAPDVSLLALNKPDDEIWIGTVAGLRPEKRLDRLIRTFAALPDRANCRLFLIGSGALEQDLKALANSLEVRERIVFPGFLERPERYLSALDIFAITSDTEQFPISLVEAMAAGLPVVATDVGDIRSILCGEQQSYICQAGDDEALLEALNALVQEPEVRKNLGRLNHEKAEKDYDIRFMLDAYRGIFA